MAYLPFSITLGRPSRTELLVLAGGLLLLASAAGGVAWWRQAMAPPPPVLAIAPTAPLVITSTPDGAHVLVDGTDQATTPASLELAPGPHALTLRAPGAIAEQRQVELGAAGAALDVRLWRARPLVRSLQPTLPGAAIADATFLADGRVGLVAMLPGDERQAWTLDPADHLAIDRFGSVAPRAPLAIRPDGRGLAFLHPSSHATSSSLVPSDRLAEVWLADLGDDQGRTVWSTGQPDEQLVDLAWAPDGQHILLVGRQRPSLGVERTSLRWLDIAGGGTQLLALLPSEVVPGSYLWRPDGRGLAFLVHTASLSAVCTLSDSGEFRYLGDLGHDGTAGPPVAPVAWGRDGQLLYAALKPPPPSASSDPLGLGAIPIGPYLADPTGGPGRPFGSTAGLSPIWWPEGRLLLAGLPSDRGTGLRLRELDNQGQSSELVSVDVPTPAATGYGLRWDLARQRALLVTNRSSAEGGHDYALLDFGWSAPA
jgi:PEGA domain